MNEEEESNLNFFFSYILFVLYMHEMIESMKKGNLIEYLII